MSHRSLCVAWPCRYLAGSTPRAPCVAFTRLVQRAFSDSPIPSPHTTVVPSNETEALALGVFDRLWERYRGRVSYVRDYEQIVAREGATFFNDHIALRSIATQDNGFGIAGVSRIFQALGYSAAECYNFEDKHLAALYFQHRNPRFPKLFISELKAWELPAPAREIIAATTARKNSMVASDALLADLARATQLCAAEREATAERAVACLHELPWAPPYESDVRELNKASQYGAWVLVHGNNVNHFTALINSHGVPALDCIEKTAAALATAGVPMKGAVEGERGARLRQTATEAVELPATMVGAAGAAQEVQWPYAYFELAQRDTYRGADGDEERYEGFLSTQATNLFEMTRTK